MALTTCAGAEVAVNRKEDHCSQGNLLSLKDEGMACLRAQLQVAAHLLYIGDRNSMRAEEDLCLLRVIEFLQLPLNQLCHRV